MFLLLKSCICHFLRLINLCFSASNNRSLLWSRSKHRAAGAKEVFEILKMTKFTFLFTLQHAKYAFSFTFQQEKYTFSCNNDIFVVSLHPNLKLIDVFFAYF